MRHSHHRKKYLCPLIRLPILCLLWWLCHRGVSEAVMQSSQALKYYTNLSNLLVLIILTLQILWTVISLCVTVYATMYTTEISPSSPWLCPHLPSLVTGGTAACIFITFLTYWAVLNQFRAPSDFHDAAVHYLVPLLYVAEFIFCEPHGRLRRWYPLLWTAPPVAYVIFVEIAHACWIWFGDSEYPYFFMDPAQMGQWGKWLLLIGLLAVYLGMGYAVLGLDRLLSRRFKVKDI